MCTIALVLACFTCFGHGRHISNERFPRSSLEERHERLKIMRAAGNEQSHEQTLATGMLGALKVLATLLLAFNPAGVCDTSRRLQEGFLVDTPACARSQVVGRRSVDCFGDGTKVGCQVQPDVFTEASAFFAERGVQLRCASTAQPGSRSFSRVPVRAAVGGGGVMVGLFKPGTHDVVPCHLDEACHIPHHPTINEAIDAVTKELDKFGEVSAYDEVAGCGTLRYLQIGVERSTCQVQLTLVANAATLDADPALSRFAAQLWASYGSPSAYENMSPVLHSIWVNLNPSRTNNIVSYGSGAWRLLHAHDGGAGPESGSIVEKLSSGAAVVLPPYVFRQSNMYSFNKIVAQVRAAVPSESCVVEWYAGVGIIGLSLAPDCKWVRCSDVNPPRDAFEASRALLEPHVQSRITYKVGNAVERIEDARGADVAIVDPPRKGLDPQLLDAFCSADNAAACAGLHTLVYISCGFRALARDADALLRSGRWRVRSGEAWAHVLFLGANHIETVVVFERIASKKKKRRR